MVISDADCFRNTCREGAVLTGNHKMFAEMVGINLRKSILKHLKQVNHMIKVVQDYGKGIEK